MNANDEQKAIRKWAMLCHLSSIFCMILFSPFLSILGPLCVWQLKKNLDPAIDSHGKESLNFQITLFIYVIIISIIFVLVASVSCGLGAASNSALSVMVTAGIILFIGVVVIQIMEIAAFILVIFAAIKASKGEFYRYPFTIRFLK